MDWGIFETFEDAHEEIANRCEHDEDRHEYHVDYVKASKLSLRDLQSLRSTRCP